MDYAAKAALPAAWGACMRETVPLSMNSSSIVGACSRTWGVGGAGAQSIGAVAFAFLASSKRAPASDHLIRHPRDPYG